MTNDTDIEIPMSLEEVSEDALHQKFFTQLAVDAADIEQSREKAVDEARMINCQGCQSDDLLETDLLTQLHLKVC